MRGAHEHQVNIPEHQLVEGVLDLLAHALLDVDVRVRQVDALADLVVPQPSRRVEHLGRDEHIRALQLARREHLAEREAEDLVRAVKVCGIEVAVAGAERDGQCAPCLLGGKAHPLRLVGPVAECAAKADCGDLRAVGELDGLAQLGLCSEAQALGSQRVSSCVRWEGYREGYTARTGSDMSIVVRRLGQRRVRSGSRTIDSVLRPDICLVSEEPVHVPVSRVLPSLRTVC